jgi:hypothetical protein
MRLISLCLLLFVLVACKKKTDTIHTNVSELKHGLLVLNEGLFNLNNASLSWIDLTTNNVSDDFFLQKTGRKLGDTGNDIQRYGGKVYVLINVSSTIEVLDAKTGQSLKQIVMQENGKAKQPRNLAFYENKVFVSCFDGYVDVIDTSSLSIEKRIKVGNNPENMTVLNHRLYVSNSGGLIPSLDSTLSVIDCQNLVELKKMVVGKNPGKILAQNDSTLYVHVRGNYNTIPSELKKIHIGLSSSQETIPIKISGMEKMENYLLIYTSESVSLYDMKANAIINTSFISLKDITTLYRIQYIESLKQLFVFDANAYTNTGYIHRFSNSGLFIQKYHVGLNPNSLIYYE